MAQPGEPLSERELDVLRCLSRGASNKDIAAELTISGHTVKAHLRNIYAKLEVSSRTEATTAAIQQGYIAVPGQLEPDDSAEQTARDGQSDQDAAIPVQASSGVADSPAQESVTSSADSMPMSRSRRLIILMIAVLSALLIGLFAGRQLLDRGQALPTAEETFAETAIGSSHWLESRPLPDARADMAVAAVGLDLYRIGGETAAGVDGAVFAFDSLNRLWRPAAEKPTPAADITAAELYGEIYVAGGRLPDGQPTSAVEAYSPTQDAWRPVASLPHPISGALTLSDGSFLYVIGGHDGESFLDTVYVYDPASDSWRPLPPIPETRAMAAGSELTGKLIVVGGRNNSGALDTCNQFDPLEEIWSDCPAMLLPRSGAGAAVLLNRLYVIGGTGREQEITFSEMYDPASETWQVINTPMLAEKASWPGLGVGQIETRIYALGGRDGETFLDSNYIFAPLVYQTYIPAASSADE